MNTEVSLFHQCFNVLLWPSTRSLTLTSKLVVPRRSSADKPIAPMSYLLPLTKLTLAEYYYAASTETLLCRLGDIVNADTAP